MEWNTLVQSLKRLYEKGSVNATLEKMKQMCQEGKITPEEFEYITGTQFTEDEN